MRTMFKSRWLLITYCLFVSACTEKTVIHEVPATGAQVSAAPGISTPNTMGNTVMPTAGIPGAPAPVINTPVPNMVGGTNGGATQLPVATLQPDTPLTNGTQTPVAGGLLSDPLATPTVIPADPVDEPIVPATTGSPGESVDCQQTLPCRWLSGDTQFAVTITNADNIGKQGRLSIEYSVLTSHDTDVLIASTEPAVDSAGARYEPSALRLGEGIGGRSQGVIAGSPITATIEFDKPGAAASIDKWSIGLSDAGLVRQPVFSGIPVGSVTRQHADCANTLPCAWQSPSKDVTITLLSANGFGSTNRLSTNFKVETTRNMVVAVDGGATATGIDGMSYKGRTHAIGLDTSAEKLTGNTIPGAQLAGTVYFFRTQSMSPALQNLSLIIYEDKPVPRWNPSFLSVPVQ